MNVSAKGNEVLRWRWTSPATTARAASWSPRTATASAPRSPSTRSRAAATKGVLTAKLTAKKGGLAGALIVREHQDLLFISQNGMVQRTAAGGISQMGRPTQGVKVMNMKDDDLVSAVALVVESTDQNGNGASASGTTVEGEAPTRGHPR